MGKHVYHPPKSIAPNDVRDHIVFDLGTFNVTFQNAPIKIQASEMSVRFPFACPELACPAAKDRFSRVTQAKSVKP